MNKSFLIGRWTGDPEVRYTPDGKAVATGTLAVDRRVAKGSTGQATDFINVQAWEKRAEFCEKYIHKGSKVAISGRIATGSYTNKEGKKVYTFTVVIEEIEFAESKGDQKEKKPEDDFVKVSDSDMPELPFN